MSYSRLHIIESGASSWLVLIGGPDAGEVAVLEEAANALLVGATLPDLGQLDGSWTQLEACVVSCRVAPWSLPPASSPATRPTCGSKD